jgi:hypothetical protein
LLLSTCFTPIEMCAITAEASHGRKHRAKE